MKKSTTIWLITAVCLILAGCIIFGSVMSVLGWDFKKLSTYKYETNSYEIAEKYTDIYIKADTANIIFVPSESGKTSVVCYEAENMEHKVSVRDNTLFIEAQDNRSWYEYIGIGFDTTKITVYLPAGEYGELTIRASTGKTEIPKDFSFEDISITKSTGSVSLKASAKDDIKVKTATGNINVEGVSAESLTLSVSTGRITASGVKCSDDVEIEVSTGKTSLRDIECENLASNGSTGNIELISVVAKEKISIETSTGNISFESSDAAEVFVRTSTGNVSGTLLNEKVFIVSTDTGKVDVPKTAGGGICEITTDTGNIELRIE